MRGPVPLLLPVALACLSGCSGPPAPKASSPRLPDPPKITQFYTTTPTLARGEKGTICYGVESSKTVWLSPPRTELSTALARCVEVTPGETTTYKLTAEGDGAPAATKELILTVGPPRARIVEVNVSSLSITRGNAVTICYHVENAASVRVPPLSYRGGSNPHGCTGDRPQTTTTYTVVANGAGGDRDEQKVTVEVR